VSEDINAAIAAKWEADGLNAESDQFDTIYQDDTPAEDVGTDEPVGEGDATPDTPAVEEPVAEEAAGEPEVDDPKKRAGWWKTRLAYSQVSKAHKDILKKAQDAHETTLKERIAEYEPFKTRDAERQQAEARIANEPEFFLPMLARLYPDKYGKLLEPILKNQPTSQNAAAQLPPIDDDNPMPEPNVPLEGGGSTYDVAGLKNFAKWVQKETAKEMRNAFKPQLDFLNTTKEQQQKAADMERLDVQSKKAAEAAVQEIASWELGTENMSEILKVANTYPESYDPLKAMSLAYNKVVLPKMKQSLTMSMEDMRKKVLEENKKKSITKTSTTAQPAIRSSVATDKPKMSDRDIILAHAKKLGI
jgi:hypothetical protein